MDPDLVTRAQGGDREAFADLVYAIADGFLAVSHRILSDIDLAEDATQQAATDAWSAAWSPAPPHSSMRPEPARRTIVQR